MGRDEGQTIGRTTAPGETIIKSEQKTLLPSIATLDVGEERAGMDADICEKLASTLDFD
jgi:hypothetical protein